MKPSGQTIKSGNTQSLETIAEAVQDERDVLQAERDALKAQCDALKAERDELISQEITVREPQAGLGIQIGNIRFVAEQGVTPEEVNAACIPHLKSGPRKAARTP
jgi:hypothetical protein